MRIVVIDSNLIKKHLPMTKAIATIKEAFKKLSEGKVTMPTRSVIKITDHQGAALFMPAYIAGSDQLGSKIVSAYPNNQAKNLPIINAIVVLLEATTGVPKAILNGTELTAIRTGAVSALATSLLARKNAEILAVVGSGKQARTQIEGICQVRNIKNIKIFSRTFAHAEKLASELKNDFKGEVSAYPHLQEVVKNADIITTVTPSTEAFLNLADIQEGTHINAIGSHAVNMKEISCDLIEKAKVFVDQKSAALAEAGELIEAIAKKQCDSENFIELGELINNIDLGRSNDKEITLFKSVGLAIQDISVAEEVYLSVTRSGEEQIIDF